MWARGIDVLAGLEASGDAALFSSTWAVGAVHATQVISVAADQIKQQRREVEWSEIKLAAGLSYDFSCTVIFVMYSVPV